ncbi:MAG TPA: hypothetical protein VIM75_10170 [Ohtaekwangia sp.]|uniref:hypothetical protein n=1 Tax=Ohtaekwangia sp. TaxID=2066019 RepID=UPI002F941AC3
MKGTKAILLFLAFLLPILIFLFLKYFGKNEFAVAPLFVTEMPEMQSGCGPVTLPYHVQDSVLAALPWKQDSLILIVFGQPDKEATTQLKRIAEEVEGGIQQKIITEAEPNFVSLKKCTFLLQEPFDLVLVDKKGTIRGQYIASDREDIDRLLTEAAIILKKY